MPPPPEATPSGGGEKGQPALGRILLVDDEVALLTALREVLTEQGYEVVAVPSGAAALAQLRAGEFDLLLTDLTMPQMDGLALLGQAKALDPQLISIMMTGQGTVPTAVEAMKRGAFDYVLKPFKLTLLLPIVARAMEVRRIRSLNADLEQRVAERTAELVELNKELEAFSYSVSHDLRAPLRNVLGFIELLTKTAGPQLEGAPRRYLTIISEEAKRMGVLIEDLLHFSRLGRAELRKLPVALPPLVREVIEGLGLEAQGRAIAWQVGSLPVVYADPALLRQVFVNLLANALKFTRPRPRAEIEIGTRPDPALDVVFVRDNGVGFDMQYAGQLFGVFRRLHRAEDFEGTGIGLAHVQRIVHRHGGRVWAEAAVEQGATFFVALPRREEGAKA